MSIDALTQLWITAFGAAALWLVNGRGERSRRWGVVAGLISQPAWYAQLVIHDQWLMVPVYTLYTLSWLRGLWVHWIRPEGER